MMAREEIFDKLNKIFRGIFDDDKIVLNDNTSFSDIDGWDSLEQFHIAVAVGNQFGIKFNINEISEMKNAGEMVDCIIQHIR